MKKSFQKPHKIVQPVVKINVTSLSAHLASLPIRCTFQTGIHVPMTVKTKYYESTQLLLLFSARATDSLKENHIQTL